MNKPTQFIYSSPEILPKLLGLKYDIVHIDDWVHKPNYNYIVVGQYSHSVINSTISLGLRGAQFWLITTMNRVGLNDGSNYVFCWEDEYSIQQAILKIADPDFETPHPQYVVPPFELITDIDRALEAFEEFTEMEVGTWFGYDYESNSFPDQTDFILTGLGIATTNKMVFIDYRLCASTPRAEWIDYQNNPDENLDKLNAAHKKFLLKHAKHCVVFNVNFELMATYRYLGDFYEYRDLNVTNIMKQWGTWCNLKWTARSILNINSWDDEFESFTSAFNELDGPDPVCSKDEDGNITEIHYSNIRKRFNWVSTADLMEIKKHAEVLNNPFYIIPSQHLGYYCALDCYNTLACWLIEMPKWNYVDNDHSDIGKRLDQMDRFPIEDRFNIMAEAGLDVYCDGKIAESIVNNGGQLLDCEWWKYCVNVNNRYILHAITALSKFYCQCQMEHFSDKNDLSDYSPAAAKLIADGIDITIGGFYLSKQLFRYRYYDENYDGCCNINAVYEDWGQQVGDELLDIVWEYTENLEGFHRKRKPHEYIGEIIDRELQLSEEVLAKHDNTIQYYNHKTLLDWYESLPWSGVNLEEYAEEYTHEGETHTIREWFDILTQRININTLQGEIQEYILEKYDAERLYGITCVQGWDYELADYYERKSYHDDMAYFFSDEAMSHMSEESIEAFKNIYNTDKYDNSFLWIYDHFQIMWHINQTYPKDYEEIMRQVREGVWTLNKFSFFTVHIYLRMFAKYFKIRTYFEGLYFEQNTNYNTLDKYWMGDYNPIDGFDQSKNVLAHPVFQANYQYSGRWSSNFHTIPSRNEVKRCTTSPDDSIFTYFDISAMEVRQIGYLAKDPKIMELYETGTDLYKFCARFMLGDEYWESLDDESKADYRSDFKVVLLAYFYLRGARSLAPELGKTVEETQEIMNSLAKTFPEAIEFRDYLSNYPLKHEGQLMTVFKEWIVSDEEPYRQVKHGINTVIQGSSAVMLVYGFYNLMKATWAKGWKFRSIGYVHDSSQSYFDLQHLWEMRQHYYDNVTQFLYDRFRVKFEFDIMCGTDYWNVCKLTQVAPDIIQLKGSGTALNQIMQRLDRNNIKYEFIDKEKYELDENGWLKTDEMPTLDDFVLSGAYEAKFKFDHSGYSIKLKKLE